MTESAARAFYDSGTGTQSAQWAAPGFTSVRVLAGQVPFTNVDDYHSFTNVNDYHRLHILDHPWEIGIVHSIRHISFLFWVARG